MFRSLLPARIRAIRAEPGADTGGTNLACLIIRQTAVLLSIVRPEPALEIPNDDPAVPLHPVFI
jgi:hypothetical protein